MSFILFNAMGSKKQGESSAAPDMPISEEERKKVHSHAGTASLRLDNFEARALLYNVKCLHILITSDIKSYWKLEFGFRTRLQKQMGFIMGVSFEIFRVYTKGRQRQYEKNKNMPIPKEQKRAVTSESTRNVEYGDIMRFY